MGGVRRSGRIAKEIDILLFGTDTSGHMFSEETTTVVLSRHGAGLVTRHKLAVDEILTIRLSGGSVEAEIRLVGQMGHETRGYTYGVEFLDANLDFWKIEFPPPPQPCLDPGSALECSICHHRQIVRQTEIEADVYALLKNILRFCATCGISTVWHEAASSLLSSADLPPLGAPAPAALVPPIALVETGALVSTVANVAPVAPRSFPAPVLLDRIAAPPPSVSSTRSPAAVSYSGEISLELSGKQTHVEEALEEGDHPSELPSTVPAVAQQTVPRKVNRRQFLRSRVNFTARVRHPELGDEIAESDDISKAGFSFRSRKSYPVDSIIEVAIPYSPGWEAIFVLACIKRAEELPGGNLFRYGAAYTTPPKTAQQS